MKRIDFIKLSAFATVAISLPLLHSCSPSATQQTMSQPIFLSRLFDKDMIKNAGKTYLKKTPAENNDKKLIQLLVSDNAIANSNNEKAIHQYLNKKIKYDFETGNTILIKGWVLAVTEARQCALFSLL